MGTSLGGRLALTASLSLSLLAACSARPDGTVVSNMNGGSGGPGSGGASGTSSGNGGTMGGASANPVAGNGGGAGASGSSGMSGGGGSSGSSGNGGNGGMIAVDDPSCNAFTPERAAYLTPAAPGVDAAVTQLATDQRLSMLNGGQRLQGEWWTIDFDATGAAPLGLPDMPMRDGPRGVSQLNNGQSTTFAVAMARGASFDTDLEYRVGKVFAAELQALKYDVLLAPTMNVLRHPGWGRAQETYSEDPVLIGELAAAFVRGVQDGGRIACPKHLAVNNTENNRGDGAEEPVVNMVVDPQTLHENYLRHFKIVVEKADPGCIMAAYNRVNGLRCTQNPDLLTTVLREQWGWKGFVVSDWWGAQPGAGADALNAGLDMEMPDNNSFNTHQSDLSSGAIDVNRVNEAAGRIINARLKFGHDTDAYKNAAANPGIVNEQAHKDLTRETAEKGAVLLKNDDILPLGEAATAAEIGTPTLSSIIVLGPDANRPHADTPSATNPSGLGDRGSSRTMPPYAISFAQGLTDRGATAGVTVTTSANAADAANADIAVIPVTMDWVDEGEGYNEGKDRVDLTLGGNHPLHWGATKPAQFIQAAAAANPNVIVVLAVGSAIVMEDWMASARGIVQSFYPGQEGGAALARLLFGDINFSGKLPFTVAIDPAHYPEFQNNTGGDATVEYLHGYRRFEESGNMPRFWFGYGQSYTSFEYGDVRVLCTSVATGGRLNVEIDVTNTGKVEGTEIVQLYIGYPNTTQRRPAKELKAFSRVTIAPGAMQTVQLSVPASDMAYWGTDGWAVETGEHSVLVGASSDPAVLKSASFTIN
jgi:beta-glucosidase